MMPYRMGSTEKYQLVESLIGPEVFVTDSKSYYKNGEVKSLLGHHEKIPGPLTKDQTHFLKEHIAKQLNELAEREELDRLVNSLSLIEKDCYSFLEDYEDVLSEFLDMEGSTVRRLVETRVSFAKRLAVK